MKILALKARNIKRLKAFGLQLDEDKGSVVISGKNGQGKSSVLDAIFYALAGGRNIPDEPVRDDADEANVTIEVGENSTQYEIVREWQPSDDKNGSLTITLPDGTEPDQSPQKLLDSMIDDLTFDPSEFLNMTSSQQRDALVEAVEFPIDIDELEEQREELYDERRVVGRELEKLQNKFEDMERPEMDEDIEDLDLKDINGQISEVRTSLENLDRIERRQEEIQAKIKELEDELDELETKKEDIPDRDGLEELMQNLKDKRKRAEAQSDVRSRIQKYDDTKEQIEETRTEYESLDEQIENIDQTKQDVLEETDLPDENLAFSQDGVLYDGKPFEQAADSEQLRAAIAVAMHSDPELRIVRLSQGSRFDRETLRDIEQLAEENDFQVWIEYVDDHGDVGIYIEDGEPRKNNDGHQLINVED